MNVLFATNHHLQRLGDEMDEILPPNGFTNGFLQAFWGSTATRSQI